MRNTDAEIGLHSPHVGVSIQGDIAHVVGCVQPIGPHTAHSNILRRLTLGTLSARDESLLKDVPDLVRLDKKHGYEFPGLLRRYPFRLNILAIVRK